ncbi:MAG: hypothetical protein AAF805_03065 [Planctomycetota bacterium]
MLATSNEFSDPTPWQSIAAEDAERAKKAAERAARHHEGGKP